MGLPEGTRLGLSFFVRTLFPRCPRLALDSAINRPAPFGRVMFPAKKEAAGPLFLVVILFFFLIECLFDEMERLFFGLIPCDFFLEAIQT